MYKQCLETAFDEMQNQSKKREQYNQNLLKTFTKLNESISDQQNQTTTQTELLKALFSKLTVNISRTSFHTEESIHLINVSYLSFFSTDQPGFISVFLNKGYNENITNIKRNKEKARNNKNFSFRQSFREKQKRSKDLNKDLLLIKP
jgi:hypothetical protein